MIDDVGKQMEDDIKRWVAKRNSALVLEIVQGKTTVAARPAGRTTCSRPEFVQWRDDGKRDMKNALKANPQDVREQYQRQLEDLRKA